MVCRFWRVLTWGLAGEGEIIVMSMANYRCARDVGLCDILLDPLLDDLLLCPTGEAFKHRSIAVCLPSCFSAWIRSGVDRCCTDLVSTSSIACGSAGEGTKALCRTTRNLTGGNRWLACRGPALVP